MAAMVLDSSDLRNVADFIAALNTAERETGVGITEAHLWSDGDILGRVICENGEMKFEGIS